VRKTHRSAAEAVARAAQRGVASQSGKRRRLKEPDARKAKPGLPAGRPAVRLAGKPDKRAGGTGYQPLSPLPSRAGGAARPELPALNTEDVREPSAAARLLKRILLEVGKTQRQLAATAGMSEAVLSHFLRGRRRSLKPRERRAIAAALGIPADALNPQSREHGIADAAIMLHPRVRLVPVYPVGAGYEISFGDGDTPAGESLEDPVYADVADHNAFAGKVVGSSMERPLSAPEEPTGFREGDIVVFDTKAEVRSGCFCLVRFEDGGTTFKQVFFQDGQVRLHPLNPQFTDEVRPRIEIKAIYRAVRHIRRI